MPKQVQKRGRMEPAKSAPKDRRSSLDSPKDAPTDMEWRAASEDMFAQPLDSRTLRAGASIRSPIATRRRTTMFVSTSSSSSRSVPASTFYGGKPDAQSERAKTGVTQASMKTVPLKDQASKTKMNTTSLSVSHDAEPPLRSALQQGRQGAARSKLTRLREPQDVSLRASATKAEKFEAPLPHAPSSSTGSVRVKASLECHQPAREVATPSAPPALKAAEATPAAVVATLPPKLSAAAAGGRPSRHQLHEALLTPATSAFSAADVSMQSATFMTPTAVMVLRDRSATNVHVGPPADAVDDSKPVRGTMPDSAAEPEQHLAAAFYTPAASAGRRKRQLAVSHSQSSADVTTPATKRARGRPKKTPLLDSARPAAEMADASVAEYASDEDDREPMSGEIMACQQVASSKVVGDAVPKEMPEAQASEPVAAANERSTDYNDMRSYRALAAYEAGDTYSTSKWCSIM